MDDITLSPEHDIVIESGDISFLPTQQDVARQSLKISLLTFKEEWRYNLEIGLPYLQEILKKSTPKIFVDNIIKRIAKNSYLVDRVEEFTSSISLDRKYNVSFKAILSNGEEIVINEEI